MCERSGLKFDRPEKGKIHQPRASAAPALGQGTQDDPLFFFPIRLGCLTPNRFEKKEEL